jgi:hypothetical protein
MNTYHVTGTLIKEYFGIQIDDENTSYFSYFNVSQEIDAATFKAASEHFQKNGWEWELPPNVTLISEAMKLERDGQPSLFDLEAIR